MKFTKNPNKKEYKNVFLFHNKKKEIINSIIEPY